MSVSKLIIKLVIIGVVIVAGIAFIYPDELIQFSKGSNLQENAEQGLSNLKDSSINEIGDSIVDDFKKAGNTIKNSITNMFNEI